MMPYCKVIELFQATDYDRSREFSSFEPLRRFLEDRYKGQLHQLSNLRAKYPEQWAEYDERNYRDFGCSAILQNQWGHRIQVGVAKEFWLVFKLGPYRPIEVSNKEDGILVFYLPEWTEFFASTLHYAAEGAKLVERWLDAGDL